MIWETKTHKFSATICQRTGKTCPALARIARALVTSVSAAGSVTTEDFQIEGSSELVHCPGGCTARFRARRDELRIYCSTTQAQDLDGLERYADLMFDPAATAMPSAGLANPPCAMLEALPLSPPAPTKAEAHACI